jgi:hypothetical protein
MQHELIYWAPRRKPGGGWLCFKSSPSPPPAPDYVGAANATAAGNLQLAEQAQQANMVNQYTPYGDLTYSQAGNWADGNPQYQSNVSLSPVGQELLDDQNNASLGLGTSIDNALGQVQQNFSQPMDLSSVGDVANQSYKNYTSLLDPQWNAATDQEQTKLANQGLVPGEEAYTNDMNTFDLGKNQAYTQAENAAIGSMPQTYYLASSIYNQPLNELNALRTGAQVSNPTFNNNTPQQQTVAGPNTLAAVTSAGQYNQGLYNAQVGQTNAENQGLYSLAASGAGALGSYLGGAGVLAMF